MFLPYDKKPVPSRCTNPNSLFVLKVLFAVASEYRSDNNLFGNLVRKLLKKLGLWGTVKRSAMGICSITTSNPAVKMLSLYDIYELPEEYDTDDEEPLSLNCDLSKLSLQAPVEKSSAHTLLKQENTSMLEKSLDVKNTSVNPVNVIETISLCDSDEDAVIVEDNDSSAKTCNSDLSKSVKSDVQINVKSRVKLEAMQSTKNKPSDYLSKARGNKAKNRSSKHLVNKDSRKQSRQYDLMDLPPSTSRCSNITLKNGTVVKIKSEHQIQIVIEEDDAILNKYAEKAPKNDVPAPQASSQIIAKPSPCKEMNKPVVSDNQVNEISSSEIFDVDTNCESTSRDIDFSVHSVEITSTTTTYPYCQKHEVSNSCFVGTSRVADANNPESLDHGSFDHVHTSSQVAQKNYEKYYDSADSCLTPSNVSTNYEEKDNLENPTPNGEKYGNVSKNSEKDDVIADSNTNRIGEGSNKNTKTTDLDKNILQNKSETLPKVNCDVSSIDNDSHKVILDLLTFIIDHVENMENRKALPNITEQSQDNIAQNTKSAETVKPFEAIESSSIEKNKSKYINDCNNGIQALLSGHPASSDEKNKSKCITDFNNGNQDLPSSMSKYTNGCNNGIQDVLSGHPALSDNDKNKLQYINNCSSDIQDLPSSMHYYRNIESESKQEIEILEYSASSYKEKNKSKYTSDCNDGIQDLPASMPDNRNIENESIHEVKTLGCSASFDEEKNNSKCTSDCDNGIQDLSPNVQYNRNFQSQSEREIKTPLGHSALLDEEENKSNGITNCNTGIHDLLSGYHALSGDEKNKSEYINDCNNGIQDFPSSMQHIINIENESTHEVKTLEYCIPSEEEKNKSQCGSGYNDGIQDLLSDVQYNTNVESESEHEIKTPLGDSALLGEEDRTNGVTNCNNDIQDLLLGHPDLSNEETDRSCTSECNDRVQDLSSSAYCNGITQNDSKLETKTLSEHSASLDEGQDESQYINDCDNGIQDLLSGHFASSNEETDKLCNDDYNNGFQDLTSSVQYNGTVENESKHETKTLLGHYAPLDEGQDESKYTIDCNNSIQDLLSGHSPLLEKEKSKSKYINNSTSDIQDLPSSEQFNKIVENESQREDVIHLGHSALSDEEIFSGKKSKKDIKNTFTCDETLSEYTVALHEQEFICDGEIKFQTVKTDLSSSDVSQQEKCEKSFEDLSQNIIAGSNKTFKECDKRSEINVKLNPNNESEVNNTEALENITELIVPLIQNNKNLENDQEAEDGIEISPHKNLSLCSSNVVATLEVGTLNEYLQNVSENRSPIKENDINLEDPQEVNCGDTFDQETEDRSDILTKSENSLPISGNEANPKSLRNADCNIAADHEYKSENFSDNSYLLMENNVNLEEDLQDPDCRITVNNQNEISCVLLEQKEIEGSSQNLSENSLPIITNGTNLNEDFHGVNYNGGLGHQNKSCCNKPAEKKVEECSQKLEENISSLMENNTKAEENLKDVDYNIAVNHEASSNVLGQNIPNLQKNISTVTENVQSPVDVWGLACNIVNSQNESSFEILEQKESEESSKNLQEHISIIENNRNSEESCHKMDIDIASLESEIKPGGVNMTQQQCSKEKPSPKLKECTYSESALNISDLSEQQLTEEPNHTPEEILSIIGNNENMGESIRTVDLNIADSHEDDTALNSCNLRTVSSERNCAIRDSATNEVELSSCDTLGKQDEHNLQNSSKGTSVITENLKNVEMGDKEVNSETTTEFSSPAIPDQQSTQENSLCLSEALTNECNFETHENELLSNPVVVDQIITIVTEQKLDECCQPTNSDVKQLETFSLLNKSSNKDKLEDHEAEVAKNVKNQEISNILQEKLEEHGNSTNCGIKQLEAISEISKSKLNEERFNTIQTLEYDKNYSKYLAAENATNKSLSMLPPKTNNISQNVLTDDEDKKVEENIKDDTEKYNHTEKEISKNVKNYDEIIPEDSDQNNGLKMDINTRTQVSTTTLTKKSDESKGDENMENIENVCNSTFIDDESTNIEYINKDKLVLDKDKIYQDQNVTMKENTSVNKFTYYHSTKNYHFVKTDLSSSIKSTLNALDPNDTVTTTQDTKFELEELYNGNTAQHSCCSITYTIPSHNDDLDRPVEIRIEELPEKGMCEHNEIPLSENIKIADAEILNGRRLSDDSGLNVLAETANKCKYMPVTPESKKSKKEGPNKRARSRLIIPNKQSFIQRKSLQKTVTKSRINFKPNEFKGVVGKQSPHRVYDAIYNISQQTSSSDDSCDSFKDNLVIAEETKNDINNTLFEEDNFKDKLLSVTKNITTSNDTKRKSVKEPKAKNAPNKSITRVKRERNQKNVRFNDEVVTIGRCTRSKTMSLFNETELTIGDKNDKNLVEVPADKDASNEVITDTPMPKPLNVKGKSKVRDPNSAEFKAKRTTRSKNKNSIPLIESKLSTDYTIESILNIPYNLRNGLTIERIDYPTPVDDDRPLNLSKRPMLNREVSIEIVNDKAHSIDLKQEVTPLKPRRNAANRKRTKHQRYIKKAEELKLDIRQELQVTECTRDEMCNSLQIPCQIIEKRELNINDIEVISQEDVKICQPFEDIKRDRHKQNDCIVQSVIKETGNEESLNSVVSSTVEKITDDDVITKVQLDSFETNTTSGKQKRNTRGKRQRKSNSISEKPKGNVDEPDEHTSVQNLLNEKGLMPEKSFNNFKERKINNIHLNDIESTDLESLENEVQIYPQELKLEKRRSITNNRKKMKDDSLLLNTAENKVLCTDATNTNKENVIEEQCKISEVTLSKDTEFIGKKNTRRTRQSSFIDDHSQEKEKFLKNYELMEKVPTKNQVRRTRRSSLVNNITEHIVSNNVFESDAKTLNACEKENSKKCIELNLNVTENHVVQSNIIETSANLSRNYSKASVKNKTLQKEHRRKSKSRKYSRYYRRKKKVACCVDTIETITTENISIPPNDETEKKCVFDAAEELDTALECTQVTTTEVDEETTVEILNIESPQDNFKIDPTGIEVENTSKSECEGTEKYRGKEHTGETETHLEEVKTVIENTAQIEIDITEPVRECVDLCEEGVIGTKEREGTIYATSTGENRIAENVLATQDTVVSQIFPEENLCVTQLNDSRISATDEICLEERPSDDQTENIVASPGKDGMKLHMQEAHIDKLEGTYLTIEGGAGLHQKDNTTTCTQERSEVDVPASEDEILSESLSTTNEKYNTRNKIDNWFNIQAVVSPFQNITQAILEVRSVTNERRDSTNVEINHETDELMDNSICKDTDYIKQFTENTEMTISNGTNLENSNDIESIDSNVNQADTLELLQANESVPKCDKTLHIPEGHICEQDVQSQGSTMDSAMGDICDKIYRTIVEVKVLNEGIELNESGSLSVHEKVEKIVRSENYNNQANLNSTSTESQVPITKDRESHNMKFSLMDTNTEKTAAVAINTNMINVEDTQHEVPTKKRKRRKSISLSVGTEAEEEQCKKNKLVTDEMILQNLPESISHLFKYKPVVKVRKVFDLEAYRDQYLCELRNKPYDTNQDKSKLTKSKRRTLDAIVDKLMTSLKRNDVCKPLPSASEITCGINSSNTLETIDNQMQSNTINIQEQFRENTCATETCESKIDRQDILTEAQLNDLQSESAEANSDTDQLELPQVMLCEQDISVVVLETTVDVEMRPEENIGEHVTPEVIEMNDDVTKMESSEITQTSVPALETTTDMEMRPEENIQQVTPEAIEMNGDVEEVEDSEMTQASIPALETTADTEMRPEENIDKQLIPEAMDMNDNIEKVGESEMTQTSVPALETTAGMEMRPAENINEQVTPEVIEMNGDVEKVEKSEMTPIPAPETTAVTEMRPKENIDKQVTLEAIEMNGNIEKVEESEVAQTSVLALETTANTEMRPKENIKEQVTPEVIELNDNIEKVEVSGMTQTSVLALETTADVEMRPEENKDEHVTPEVIETNDDIEKVGEFEISSPEGNVDEHVTPEVIEMNDEIEKVESSEISSSEENINKYVIAEVIEINSNIEKVGKSEMSQTSVLVLETTTEMEMRPEENKDEYVTPEGIETNDDIEKVGEFEISSPEGNIDEHVTPEVIEMNDEIEKVDRSEISSSEVNINKYVIPEVIEMNGSIEKVGKSEMSQTSVLVLETSAEMEMQPEENKDEHVTPEAIEMNDEIEKVERSEISSSEENINEYVIAEVTETNNSVEKVGKSEMSQTSGLILETTAEIEMRSEENEDEYVTHEVIEMNDDTEKMERSEISSPEKNINEHVIPEVIDINDDIEKMERFEISSPEADIDEHVTPEVIEMNDAIGKVERPDISSLQENIDEHVTPEVIEMNDEIEKVEKSEMSSPEENIDEPVTPEVIEMNDGIEKIERSEMSSPQENIDQHTTPEVIEMNDEIEKVDKSEMSSPEENIDEHVTLEAIEIRGDIEKSEMGHTFVVAHETPANMDVQQKDMNDDIEKPQKFEILQKDPDMELRTDMEVHAEDNDSGTHITAEVVEVNDATEKLKQLVQRSRQNNSDVILDVVPDVEIQSKENLDRHVIYEAIEVNDDKEVEQIDEVAADMQIQSDINSVKHVILDAVDMNSDVVKLEKSEAAQESEQDVSKITLEMAADMATHSKEYVDKHVVDDDDVDMSDNIEILEKSDVIQSEQAVAFDTVVDVEVSSDENTALEVVEKVTVIERVKNMEALSDDNMKYIFPEEAKMDPEKNISMPIPEGVENTDILSDKALYKYSSTEEKNFETAPEKLQKDFQKNRKTSRGCDNVPIEIVTEHILQISPEKCGKQFMFGKQQQEYVVGELTSPIENLEAMQSEQMDCHLEETIEMDKEPKISEDPSMNQNICNEEVEVVSLTGGTNTQEVIPHKEVLNRDNHYTSAQSEDLFSFPAEVGDKVQLKIDESSENTLQNSTDSKQMEDNKNCSNKMENTQIGSKTSLALDSGPPSLKINSAKLISVQTAAEIPVCQHVENPETNVNCTLDSHDNNCKSRGLSSTHVLQNSSTDISNTTIMTTENIPRPKPLSRHFAEPIIEEAFCTNDNPLLSECTLKVPRAKELLQKYKFMQEEPYDDSSSGDYGLSTDSHACHIRSETTVKQVETTPDSTCQLASTSESIQSTEPIETTETVVEDTYIDQHIQFEDITSKENYLTAENTNEDNDSSKTIVQQHIDNGFDNTHMLSSNLVPFSTQYPDKFQNNNLSYHNQSITRNISNVSFDADQFLSDVMLDKRLLYLESCNELLENMHTSNMQIDSPYTKIIRALDEVPTITSTNNVTTGSMEKITNLEVHGRIASTDNVTTGSIEKITNHEANVSRSEVNGMDNGGGFNVAVPLNETIDVDDPQLAEKVKFMGSVKIGSESSDHDYIHYGGPLLVGKYEQPHNNESPEMSPSRQVSIGAHTENAMVPVSSPDSLVNTVTEQYDPLGYNFIDTQDYNFMNKILANEIPHQTSIADTSSQFESTFSNDNLISSTRIDDTNGPDFTINSFPLSDCALCDIEDYYSTETISPEKIIVDPLKTLHTIPKSVVDVPQTTTVNEYDFLSADNMLKDNTFTCPGPKKLNTSDSLIECAKKIKEKELKKKKVKTKAERKMIELDDVFPIRRNNRTPVSAPPLLKKKDDKVENSDDSKKISKDNVEQTDWKSQDNLQKWSPHLCSKDVSTQQIANKQSPKNVLEPISKQTRLNFESQEELEKKPDKLEKLIFAIFDDTDLDGVDTPNILESPTRVIVKKNEYDYASTDNLYNVAYGNAKKEDTREGDTEKQKPLGKKLEFPSLKKNESLNLLLDTPEVETENNIESQVKLNEKHCSVEKPNLKQKNDDKSTNYKEENQSSITGNIDDTTKDKKEECNNASAEKHDAVVENNIKALQNESVKDDLKIKKEKNDVKTAENPSKEKETMPTHTRIPKIQPDQIKQREKVKDHKVLEPPEEVSSSEPSREKTSLLSTTTTPQKYQSEVQKWRPDLPNQYHQKMKSSSSSLSQYPKLPYSVHQRSESRSGMRPLTYVRKEETSKPGEKPGHSSSTSKNYYQSSSNNYPPQGYYPRQDWKYDRPPSRIEQRKSSYSRQERSSLQEPSKSSSRNFPTNDKSYWEHKNPNRPHQSRSERIMGSDYQKQSDPRVSVSSNRAPQSRSERNTEVQYQVLDNATFSRNKYDEIKRRSYEKALRNQLNNTHEKYYQLTRTSKDRPKRKSPSMEHNGVTKIRKIEEGRKDSQHRKRGRSPSDEVTSKQQRDLDKIFSKLREEGNINKNFKMKFPSDNCPPSTKSASDDNWFEKVPEQFFLKEARYVTFGSVTKRNSDKHS